MGTARENNERSRDDYPEGNESQYELVEFCAGVALTLLTPTLLFCIVIGQLWPLWVMICNEALGAVAGFVVFKKASVGFRPAGSYPTSESLHVTGALAN